MRLFLASLTLSALLASSSVLAAKINMYDTPVDTAKVSGTIDLANGVIPIFSPPNSEWTKVADPTNGNTGWVKNSELKDSNGNVITFQQKVASDNNGQSQSVQMSSSYGNPANLTPDEKKKLEKDQQQNLDAAMKLQENATKLLNDAKKVYQQQIETMQKMGYPMVPLPGMQPTNDTNQNQQPAAVPR